jgi:hypothetical protein
METQKPPEFCQIRQTKLSPYRFGPIRKNSPKNWGTARNIFCPSDDFQIRQNCRNMEKKTEENGHLVTLGSPHTSARFNYDSTTVSNLVD